MISCTPLTAISILMLPCLVMTFFFEGTGRHGSELLYDVVDFCSKEGGGGPHRAEAHRRDGMSDGLVPGKMYNLYFEIRICCSIFHLVFEI